jgi:predicted acetyltransferase
MIELKELSLDDKAKIYDMLHEIGPGENGFENRGYYVDNINFEDYLLGNIEMSKGVNLNPKLVPQTIYWLYMDNQPVGIGKIRDYLNRNLMISGGHIGYCIRPSKRGYGYGSTILLELLKKAKEKNITKVLITCRDYNIPSRKVIEKNGGKFQDINDHICRYWIDNL